MRELGYENENRFCVTTSRRLHTRDHTTHKTLDEQHTTAVANTTVLCVHPLHVYTLYRLYTLCRAASDSTYGLRLCYLHSSLVGWIGPMRIVVVVVVVALAQRFSDRNSHNTIAATTVSCEDTEGCVLQQRRRAADKDARSSCGCVCVFVYVCG